MFLGVMYSGHDVCGVTWSLYQRNQILFRNITRSNRSDGVAQLAEHLASIRKIVGLIPVVQGRVGGGFLHSGTDFLTVYVCHGGDAR